MKAIKSLRCMAWEKTRYLNRGGVCPPVDVGALNPNAGHQLSNSAHFFPRAPIQEHSGFMISPEFLAVTYGLSSALTWGAGDFSGGVAAKRSNVLTVILFSQIVGAALLILLALCFAGGIPSSRHLLLGVSAGISGSFGLVALYRGLALSRMGIVAPISAVVTAIIPMAFGFFQEGLPQKTQLMGFLTALFSVWLISSSAGEAKRRANECLLPVAAGVCFGLFFILIDRVSEEAILWPLVAARGGSICSMLTVFLVLRHKLETPVKSQRLFIVSAGIFDAGGNAFFALATQLGRLDTSAILSSLYPGATVMLAWLILKERLTRRQWFGVIAALFALVLIAS